MGELSARQRRRRRCRRRRRRCIRDRFSRRNEMRMIRSIATKTASDWVDLIHLFTPPANEDFWDLWAQ